MIKAMYFRFYCITHSCSDTCIYKYRSFFVKFFVVCLYTVKEQVGNIPH